MNDPWKVGRIRQREVNLATAHQAALREGRNLPSFSFGKMGKLRRIHLQLSPKQNKNMPITGKSRLRPCVGDSAVAVRSGLHLHPLHPFGATGIRRRIGRAMRHTTYSRSRAPHEVTQAGGAERTGPPPAARRCPRRPPCVRTSCSSSTTCIASCWAGTRKRGACCTG